MYVVENWVLRTESDAVYADDGVKFNFDHMAGRHAAAFCEGVDKGLVEIDHKGFL